MDKTTTFIYIVSFLAISFAQKQFDDTSKSCDKIHVTTSENPIKSEYLSSSDPCELSTFTDEYGQHTTMTTTLVPTVPKFNLYEIPIILVLCIVIGCLISTCVYLICCGKSLEGSRYSSRIEPMPTILEETNEDEIFDSDMADAISLSDIRIPAEAST